MKRTLVVVFAFLFFTTRLASADVQISIADYPERVLSYSPVFITGVIENYGSEPVLIPASNVSDCGYFIQTGSTTDDLKERMPIGWIGAYRGEVRIGFLSKHRAPLQEPQRPSV